MRKINDVAWYFTSREKSNFGRPNSISMFRLHIKYNRLGRGLKINRQALAFF